MKQEEQGLYNRQVEVETMESLRQKLAEAEKTIENLKRALGGNHPLGTMKKGMFG